MWPVHVQHHPGFRITFGMTVTADVGPGLEYLDGIPGVGQLVGNHRPGKSCTDNGDWFHLIFCWMHII